MNLDKQWRILSEWHKCVTDVHEEHSEDGNISKEGFDNCTSINVELHKTNGDCLTKTDYDKLSGCDDLISSDSSDESSDQVSVQQLPLELVSVPGKRFIG